MKKILYFFVGCILFGFLVSFIFSLVPVFTTSATGFFLTIKQDRYEDAYSIMSDQFRNQYDLETFKSMIKQAELDKFQSVKWTKTYTNDKNTEGYVLGTITTTTGKTIPVKVYFVSSGGNTWIDRGWSIQTIEVPPPPKKD